VQHAAGAICSEQQHFFNTLPNNCVVSSHAFPLPRQKSGTAFYCLLAILRLLNLASTASKQIIFARSTVSIPDSVCMHLMLLCLTMLHVIRPCMCVLFTAHSPMSTIKNNFSASCNIQGVPIKSNPLDKIHYFSYCNRFFHQICRFHRGGFRPHMQHISLQYLLSFRNYNHLNLKVQFSQWTNNYTAILM